MNRLHRLRLGGSIRWCEVNVKEIFQRFSDHEKAHLISVFASREEKLLRLAVTRQQFGNNSETSWKQLTDFCPEIYWRFLSASFAASCLRQLKDTAGCACQDIAGFICTGICIAICTSICIAIFTGIFTGIFKGI